MIWGLLITFGLMFILFPLLVMWVVNKMDPRRKRKGE